jgi:phosphoribosylamine--glycine ligase
VERLYCAPGNAGIDGIAQCVAIGVEDIDALLKFALEKKIDLTIVGPEVSLVKGIVDAFTKKGLKIFGPTQEAAQLEGSKAFCKDFMHRRNIPTAMYKVFDTDA